MKLDFTEQTIIVTGATRGIGMQIANDLHELGANLILTGTRQDEIDKLNADAISNRLRKQFFCVELSDGVSLNRFISNIEKFNKIDGLVNNAGINRLNFVNDVTDNDWDDMLSVNLTAPMKIIRAVAGKMKENNFGRIVNIASIFSKISKEKRSAYSATKFGLHGLTVGVSNDLARNNILVNSVSPGFIMTELTKKNLSETEMQELATMVPSKRLGQVSDISGVVVFLLSDINQYLTGQNIIVDGGFTNV